MKKLLTIFSISLFLVACGTSTKTSIDLADKTPILSFIDLTKVTNDQVPVIINPGRFTQETVTYRLPRVVQGTYSVSDFGKYIADLTAYDYNGNKLPVTKIDTNSWTISNATNLDYITYMVNDTFDIEETGGIGGDTPFSPAGTNIEPDNYMLNLHGFIGYFDSLKNSQYAVDIAAPANFIRTSSLKSVAEKTSEDGKTITTSYFAPRYFDITDNPMMYGNLDVEEFQVGDIKIVLSMYSPNQVHTAKALGEIMKTMMEAQKAYLGDINSTPRYDIYLYLSRGDEDSPKGFGALEHHTSTTVVMPEAIPFEALAESMIDVVSHEFFHIVTPLNVHSEDVHYFDYHKPTFSRHLWMYEGVTEYFATLFQVDQNLISEDEFYAKITGKIQSAAGMDDAMSFTIMSQNVLDEPYASQYYNVYDKGALIGMCIDILMREESNGNRSMLSLMKQLSQKYGQTKPFEDAKLIGEITEMTYPSVGEFLQTHVVGDLPINYNYFFAKVGLEIGESRIETNLLQNNDTLIFGANQEDGSIYFNSLVENNSFWHDHGVQPNDVIKTIDGEEVNIMSANGIFQKIFMWEPGKEIELKVERAGKEVVIKAKVAKSYTLGKNLIENPKATESQKALRKAWLKG